MKGPIEMSIIILLFVPTAALASLQYPQFILNEATRECSVFHAGDECVACRVPEGWILMPTGTGYQCPEGYRKVEIKPVCYPQKNPFCCTQGHSGAPGNCKDLVINEKEKKCSFVDDIEKCVKLPEGWQRPQGELACPSLSYGWPETLLACLGEYAPPLIKGKRVDLCLTWGTDCGQPAADHFCKIQGYAKAETWHWENVESTVILGDGKQCSGKGRCGGFSFIRCTRANQKNSSMGSAGRRVGTGASSEQRQRGKTGDHRIKAPERDCLWSLASKRDAGTGGRSECEMGMLSQCHNSGRDVYHCRF